MSNLATAPASAEMAQPIRSVPSRVREAAERRPTAVAVVSGDQTLDYTTLLTRADQSRGPTPGQRAGPRFPGGDLRPAIRRLRRRRAGHTDYRCGLRADRSELSDRPPGLSGHPGAGGRTVDYGRTRDRAWPGRLAGHDHRQLDPRTLAGARPARDQPRRPRVRDLHLGFDRHAEGRRDPASRPDQPGRLASSPLRADVGRPYVADRRSRVRRVGLGALAEPGRGGHAGHPTRAGPALAAPAARLAGGAGHHRQLHAHGPRRTADHSGLAGPDPAPHPADRR